MITEVINQRMHMDNKQKVWNLLLFYIFTKTILLHLPYILRFGDRPEETNDCLEKM